MEISSARSRVGFRECKGMVIRRSKYSTEEHFLPLCIPQRLRKGHQRTGLSWEIAIAAGPQGRNLFVYPFGTHLTFSKFGPPSSIA